MPSSDTYFKKGEKPSQEVINKRVLTATGKKRSEESKKKMSLAQMGKKLTEETKKKMSMARKGKNNHAWKGGVTPINSRIRGSLEYKLWRKAVFDRDGYKCIWCGIVGYRNNLQADHIQLFSQYPELRFAIDNGRTLCRKCNIKRHTKNK